MAKRNNNQHKHKASKSGKNRTPISGHKKVGSQLLPPFAALMGGMQFSSWMNDRLPEMLWAALIHAAVERDYALGQFRRILNFIAKHEKKVELHDLMHTGIAKLEPQLRREIIQFIVEPPETAAALATLKLFENLPARDDWDSALPNIEPNVGLLMDAVGSTLWHQSQEATDCRWLRLMAQVMAGRFHLPADFGDEWFKYPNEGDQRSVRPSIRAAEMAQNPFEPPDLTWPRAFWEEAWTHTPCIELIKCPTPIQIDETITRQAISNITDVLETHWKQTHSTTSIDAKHDAIFGMALYSLRVLDEMLGIGIGTGILGRLGLRTILEIRVNLRYLLTKDNPELWKKWREYGAGQAKLNALKFDDAPEPPKHIDIESIEAIAGEDLWEEFLTVNLAGWSGLDLRKLSEQSGLKETYDRHYSWTSGYSHGMWGPIRESCYRTCGNPLHRLHRYPERRSLADSVEDAAVLVDEILDDVHTAYPAFEARLTKTSTESGPHD
jgi:hypothetical protein